MANALEMKNIYKKYGEKHTEVIALEELSLAVQPDEFTVAIDPPGSGKSTFSTIAVGLQVPTSGEITVSKQSLNRLTKRQRLAQRS